MAEASIEKTPQPEEPPSVEVETDLKVEGYDEETPIKQSLSTKFKESSYEPMAVPPKSAGVEEDLEKMVEKLEVDEPVAEPTSGQDYGIKNPVNF